ncbi:MAG TPA: hypothetical protein DCM07_20205 [Planctomycetaceae bacterium]|nr:hypothetical protein [Gimesia sp.]HAH47131.1 hypothetical protein [Planctomycetaceae bacterium]HBL41770.1 hypothetical protein [Planctomycetaceae bacterium]
MYTADLIFSILIFFKWQGKYSFQSSFEYPGRHGQKRSHQQRFYLLAYRLNNSERDRQQITDKLEQDLLKI